MKEQIIVAKGINNREFAFTLAKNGKASLNQKVMTPYQLSQLALNRNGVYINNQIVSVDDAVFIIGNIIKINKPDYFKNASFQDYVNLSKSMDELRYLIGEDEQEGLEKFVNDAEFTEKNKAIKDIYDLYRKHLEDNNLRDRIDIIREVIENNYKLDVDVYSLDEYPLSILENKLIETVTGKPVISKSITEYFDNAKHSTISFKKVYGNSNEIENVLADIKENNYSLGDCCIAYTDPSYCQLIYDYSKNYNIGCEFLAGVPIVNTNASKFVAYYYQYLLSNCNTDSFKNWIYSESFNTKKLFEKIGLNNKDEELFVKAVGYLKLGMKDGKIPERAENYQKILRSSNETDMKPYIVKFAEELDKGIRYMVKEYCYTGNIPMELYGLEKMRDYIYDYDNHNEIVSFEEILNYAINSTVQPDRNSQVIDTIAVVPINKALPSIRKHMYVVGMSANYFPPKSNENYLLLDSDYQIFMGNKYVKSNEDLKLQKEIFYKLIKLTDMVNSNIYLSYSDYDLAELKANNPSSVLFEVYQSKYGSDKTVKDFEKHLDSNKSGYFQYGITKAERYGSHYVQGETINPQKVEISENEYVNKLTVRAYSPTAIIEYFNCPRHFFWTRVLKINENDEDDPYNVIPADDKGTLFHKQMEDAANGRDMKTGKIVISEKEFLDKTEKEFDDYLKYRTPIQPDDVNKAKEEFMQMAKNEFKHDVNNIIVSAESESQRIMVDEVGIQVRGIADRVELDRDGNLFIGDYKTGKTIHHDPNDWQSCIQVLIYAYITEKLNVGKEVQDCQFRYVALDKTVEINYPNYKSAMIDKLKEFKENLETLSFPYTDDKDNCKYCRLKEICRKDSAKEGNDNE